MARVFSLQTVLRQVPKTLLGRFFQRFSVTFPDLDWQSLRERDILPILDAISTMSRDEMIRLESELRSVFDMSCEGGINALIESAIAMGHPDLAAELPQEMSPYGQAMWVWLEHRDYFTQAGLFYQVDQLTWWRKRNDLPCKEPGKSPEDRDLLRREISRLLLTEQGRGRLCSIELLERGPMIYFFAYPDDFVQSIQEHDAEGQLTPRVVRQTFSIVFAYDREAGTLELFAKVPGKLKPRLEELFARYLLDTELGPWPSPPAFAINQLRSRSSKLVIDPVDGVTVLIKRLRFEIPGTKRFLELEANPEGGPRDIYDMIDEYLNQDRLRIDDLKVKSVSLVFSFAELGNRRAGSCTVEIGFPSSCNLQHHRPERVEIIQKYLIRWGIDVRPDGSQSSSSPRPRTAAVA